MYKLSKRSKERLNGVHPLIVTIIEKAISAPDCPDDFGIPQYGGLRSVEDQQELYAKGRTDFSTHTKPVTYTDGIKKRSNHQAQDDGFGYAFDVYIYDHKTKRASWNVQRLEKLAKHLIKIASLNGLKLEWGGHWKSFKDYPHFQLKK